MANIIIFVLNTCMHQLPFSFSFYKISEQLEESTRKPVVVLAGVDRHLIKVLG